MVISLMLEISPLGCGSTYKLPSFGLGKEVTEEEGEGRGMAVDRS